MYNHLTLFILWPKWDGIKDKWTKGGRDNPNTRSPFQARFIKIHTNLILQTSYTIHFNQTIHSSTKSNTQQYLHYVFRINGSNINICTSNKKLHCLVKVSVCRSCRLSMKFNIQVYQLRWYNIWHICDFMTIFSCLPR